MHTTHVEPDADALASRVATTLAAEVASIVEAGRTPRIVLTGGTIANAIYELLDADAADWSKVEWYWGDERFVAPDDDDRNELQARRAFLDRLGIAEAKIRPMAADDGTLSISDAARAYASELPADPFDVVLLGVGPDGHVASLFPHHDSTLHESSRQVVEETDSPKPPPPRLSLTFRSLNNARQAWLIVSGDGKSEAVCRALAEEGTVEAVPARGIRAIEETIWWLDDEAASQL